MKIGANNLQSQHKTPPQDLEYVVLKNTTGFVNWELTDTLNRSSVNKGLKIIGR